jgi:hypothetical protein
LYNNHTQNPAKRKATSIKASDRSAETLAPQMPRKLSRNAPQKSRTEKLAAVDEWMTDFDRKAEWVSREIYHSLNSDRWINCWKIQKVPKRQRKEFEQIIATLRSRDPVLREAIERIQWGVGVVVWLNQGGSNRG